MVYSYQAYLHAHKGGSFIIHEPEPKLSTAENILHLLRPDSKYTPLEAQLLDIALVLHAEHGGGNNSTFTTHVVTSSGTDTYSAVVSSLGSLKGPKHGGANLKVVQMFDNIKENVHNWNDDDELREYLKKCCINRHLTIQAWFMEWDMRSILYPTQEQESLRALSKSYPLKKENMMSISLWQMWKELLLSLLPVSERYIRV